MHNGRRGVSIVSNLETRELEAWLGGAHLWSTVPTEPGSADEVAGFFAMTLVRLLEVVEGMSAHERMDLLAMAVASNAASSDASTVSVLGHFRSD
ncbi:hypothetical protein SAMN04490244_107167 [Tranquillimonas rosea]|uniref:Uncharacterized protein n=1 Tax=Tranquillimonas rosea TaxID=641238 RepID=A0A1H9VJC5_9RHOB|nr:hypothetical protein [Tranquillimonas rosea]SES21866.1 hypothetical protein SAMN04490244_107167 [Tranquillimonas rosea]